MQRPGRDRLVLVPVIVLLSVVSLWGEAPKPSYIRDTAIAPLRVPPVKGELYNDIVPDTLDIAERAELAINIITCNPDPKADYETHERTCFFHNPIFMWHDFDDWFCSQWKFYEALTLVRLMTGSHLNRQVDDVWLSVRLKSIGDDGLIYMPLQDRPWRRINVCWAPQVWRADGTTTDSRDPSLAYISHPLPMGRAMAEYTLTPRGTTVIAIDPPGENCPLYQREYFRGNMPWRPVRRFLADRVIDY